MENQWWLWNTGKDNMIDNNYLDMLTRQTDEWSPMGFVYRALADFDARLRYLEQEPVSGKRLDSMDEVSSDLQEQINELGRNITTLQGVVNSERRRSILDLRGRVSE